MKDEHGGKSFLKFVGLKTKMYSLLDESNDEKILVLQSFQNFMKHYLRKGFLDTQLEEQGLKVILAPMKLIKRSLSFFDDKRYILKNGIDTLTYGHKDIQK